MQIVTEEAASRHGHSPADRARNAGAVQVQGRLPAGRTQHNGMHVRQLERGHARLPRK